ncbi:MAG: right-handed parallel beta-helix repeat-containing protein [Lentisphaeria bacterium]|nr:right-handed parallel beta-helix repeat-containing protein [Lentisphaeria bacterium]
MIAKRIFLYAAALSMTAFSAGKPELVSKVKSGELKEAKASWWGFDPTDSTVALQDAINSGASKLIIDNVGRTWITRPLFAASNQEIFFEKGVVIEAKKGEFKGGNDTLLTVSLKENVILNGYGATLRMHRADYDDPKQYKRAEWRHTLSLRSARNVKVYGLTLALSGGDGIYLGVAKRGVTNENIHIKDVVCDRNYRQGISVISAKNLLIEDTIMKDTGGTPPAAGIDFEPNHPSEQLVNCVMRNCVTENNQGHGYMYYLPNLHAESPPLSLRLENCVSRNDAVSFGFITSNSESDAVGGAIDVVGCLFEKPRGEGISIRRKPAGGAKVRFKECVIDSPGRSPIVVSSRPGCPRTIGGVDFGSLTVVDPAERLFIDYFDWLGGGGVTSLRGTVTLRHGDVETVTELTPEWLKKTFPIRVVKMIAPLELDDVKLVPADTSAEASVSAAPYYLRKQGMAVFWAAAGEQVRLKLEFAQVGKYGGRKMKIVAVAPSGKKIIVGEIPFLETKELTFAAPETGLYHLPLNAGANRCGILECSPPVAVSGESGEIRFISSAGDLFFLVPAGTKEFGLLVYGEGTGEGVKATVFDEKGIKVWEKDDITRPQMFASTTPPPVRDEVWRLRLERATNIMCEDNYVDMRGIPPFLSRDPKALLKVAK